MATSDSNISSSEFILAESRFDGLVKPVMDGWQRQGDCTLTFSPTDGSPAGCLKAVDAATGDVFYYKAPAKFLGNKETAVRLEYDIKWVANPALPIFPWDREVEIAGGGTVLIFHPGTPARGEWVHCVVPFQPAGWKNLTTNSPATDDDFKVVLDSLTKLLIRGEFAHGAETGFLDNVVMYSR